MPTASKKSLATVVVVALVVLSGCAMFTESITPTAEPTPSATPSPTPTPTPTATPTATPTPTPTATPTPTPTPTATPSPTPTPEPGFTAEDWQSLLDRHSETLTGADSWRGGIVIRYSGDESALRDGEQNISIGGARNGDEKRRLLEFGNVSQDYYTAGSDDPTFVQFNNSGEVTYSRNDQAIEFPAFERPFGPEFLADFDLTDEGIVDTARGERRKLTVDDLSAVGERPRENLDGELTDVNLQIFLDPDGEVITTIAYELTLERESGSVTIRYEFVVLDVNSATVDRPDWLDEARDSTES